MARIKPARGFAQLLHYALLLVLPLALLVLVRLGGGFIGIALSLILLTKWRMFAVRPRFWAANLRANAVDITIGLSAVLFMAHTVSGLTQFSLALLYAFWLMFIKPGSGTLLVAAQAMLAQLAGLTVVFMIGADAPLFLLVLAVGVICYVSARHFFDNFDEPYAKFLSYLWAYFGAALTWILGHWLLYYGQIAQPTLFLTMVGYCLAALYYFDHEEKLSVGMRRYTTVSMFAAIVIVIAVTWFLGGWGNKVV